MFWAARALHPKQRVFFSFLIYLKNILKINLNRIWEIFGVLVVMGIDHCNYWSTRNSAVISSR
eukprot:34271_3